MINFQDLGLSAPLLRAIEEKGYENPTPIQEQAIPPVLRGRDLQGCAQTGTGKTAAFTLPILQLLAAEPPVRGRREIRALVLTPTRELAIQIDECCRDYARYMPIRHCVIFGGVNQRPQVEALQQGVDLLVATPGRLLDLIGQGYISLTHLRFFVLDEADRMLDMGFIHDIRRILPLLPERRQTLFFSATMPAEIAALAARILHDPELVSVTPPASVVETIAQRVHFAEKSEKSALLIDLLRHSEARQVLVFTRTKHGADRLARILNKAGIEAAALHGNKSQNARVRAMNDFKSGACRVLIATDIAARGIDIDQLPLVINYELPEVAETYVHRIGRTGRAGRDGAAWSFCSEAELEYLLDIQRLTGLTIPVEGEVPEYAARALAEAERKQAAKAGRRSAPHSAPKAAPAPKRKEKEARPAATPAGAPAIAPQAEAREKAEKMEQGEKTGKAPQPQPSESLENSQKAQGPQPSEHPEKPEKRESSEISAAENAPKKRRRRRHRGQGPEHGVGNGPEEAGIGAGAERAEPAAMESSAATVETSGTKPAAGVPRPSHAATQPAEPTGLGSGAAPEAAAEPQSASAASATSAASAASAPESGDKPRKRRRKKSAPTADSAAGSASETAARQKPAAPVAEKAPKTAARQNTATPAAGEAPKTAARQKPATPAAEEAPKTAARQKPADSAPEKQPSARPGTKRNTPNPSARPEKARTHNAPRLEYVDNEPKTGIERARNRRVPDREHEQSKSQKEIPHTNDWKNRVKSLLLRSFRK